MRSSIFEFMFLDRPVVTLRTNIPGPYLIDVNDVDDLEAALAEAASRPEALLGEARSLCSELHSYTDGCSSARVINAVDGFLDTGVARLKPKPLNLVRKLKVRRRLKKELRKNFR